LVANKQETIMTTVLVFLGIASGLAVLALSLWLSAAWERKSRERKRTRSWLPSSSQNRDDASASHIGSEGSTHSYEGGQD
jgi:hypothetical protein